jgi:hypothetical protein
MNKWETLCKSVKPLLGKNLLEAVYHDSFKVWLETIFNWPEANLDREVKVMIGSGKRADIVAEGDDFTLVIEMKRPDIILNAGHAGELLYYMQQLSKTLKKPCPYGLLVGNEIHVFYDNDPTKAQNEIKPVVRFDFNNLANPYGIALGEVLDFNACSNEKLREYVEEMVPLIKETEEQAARTEEERRRQQTAEREHSRTALSVQKSAQADTTHEREAVIKVREIARHFENHGYRMKCHVRPKDTRVEWERNKDDKNSPNFLIHFSIEDRAKDGIIFRWTNSGKKCEKYNKAWYENKNREIKKIYPRSEVTLGDKNPAWVRLYIPVDQGDYLNSLLEIAQKTKDIMLK